MKPAIEQQNYISPAAFPRTILPNQNQASTPARGRFAIEQQNYVLPNSAYPPTVPSNQNQASTFTQAEQRQLLPAPTLQPDLSTGIVGGRRPTAAYPPSPISSNQNQRSNTPIRATPAAEQHNMLPPNKAVEAEQRVQAEIKAAFEQERRAEAAAAERENVEAEWRVRAQRDAMERNRAALAAREQARVASRNPSILTADGDGAAAKLPEHANRARASQAEPPTRAETNAMLAERNRAARLAVAHENSKRIPEEEQRVRAQWEANERNRAAAAAARGQALDNSPNPPVATANANRAAAISAEPENMEGISEVDQRIKAQRDTPVARNRVALPAAHA